MKNTTQKLSAASCRLVQFLYQVMQTIIFVLLSPLHFLLIAVLVPLDCLAFLVTAMLVSISTG